MRGLRQYEDGSPFPKFQVEHGPIYTKNIRCSVIKILAGTQEDKERIRWFLKEHEDFLQGNEFIPEAEF